MHIKRVSHFSVCVRATPSHSGVNFNRRKFHQQKNQIISICAAMTEQTPTLTTVTSSVHSESVVVAANDEISQSETDSCIGALLPPAINDAPNKSLPGHSSSSASDVEEKLTSVAPSVTVSSRYPDLSSNIHKLLSNRATIKELTTAQRTLRDEIITQLKNVNQSGVLVEDHRIVLQQKDKRVRRSKEDYKAFIGKFLKRKGVDDWKQSCETILKGQTLLGGSVSDTLTITKRPKKIH